MGLSVSSPLKVNDYGMVWKVLLGHLFGLRPYAFSEVIRWIFHPDELLLPQIQFIVGRVVGSDDRRKRRNHELGESLLVSGGIKAGEELPQGLKIR
jgi:hypothetical protein